MIQLIINVVRYNLPFTAQCLLAVNIVREVVILRLRFQTEVRKGKRGRESTESLFLARDVLIEMRPGFKVCVNV